MNSKKEFYDNMMKETIDRLSKTDYSLYSEFDPVKHSKKFINYCEVIIDREGIIRYATPSHISLLQALYGVEQGLLNKDVLDSKATYMRTDVNMIETIQNYLDEYQAPTGIDYIGIMLHDTSSIMIWYDRYDFGRERLNDKQKASLKLLKDNNCISFDIDELMNK